MQITTFNLALTYLIYSLPFLFFSFYLVLYLDLGHINCSRFWCRLPYKNMLSLLLLWDRIGIACTSLSSHTYRAGSSDYALFFNYSGWTNHNFLMSLVLIFFSKTLHGHDRPCNCRKLKATLLYWNVLLLECSSLLFFQLFFLISLFCCFLIFTAFAQEDSPN